MTTNAIALAEAARKHAALTRVTVANIATYASGPGRVFCPGAQHRLGRSNAEAPDTIATAHSCDQPPRCWLPQGQPAPASSPRSGASALFNAKEMETVRDGCRE